MFFRLLLMAGNGLGFCYRVNACQPFGHAPCGLKTNKSHATTLETTGIMAEGSKTGVFRDRRMKFKCELGEGRGIRLQNSSEVE